jgi:uncharacterized protein
MKRYYINSIFILFSLVFSCFVPACRKDIAKFVYDNESILTLDQSKQFDSLFRGHEKRTTNEIVLVTTSNYGKFDNQLLFSVDFGRKYGIGKKDLDNGVVIVFSKAKREIRISTGYGTENILKDELAKKIIDSLMLPKFKDSLYFEGLRDGSIAIVKFLDKPENKIKIRSKK